MEVCEAAACGFQARAQCVNCGRRLCGREFDDTPHPFRARGFVAQRPELFGDVSVPPESLVEGWLYAYGEPECLACRESRLPTLRKLFSDAQQRQAEREQRDAAALAQLQRDVAAFVASNRAPTKLRWGLHGWLLGSYDYDAERDYGNWTGNAFRWLGDDGLLYASPSAKGRVSRDAWGVEVTLELEGLVRKVVGSPTE